MTGRVNRRGRGVRIVDPDTRIGDVPERDVPTSIARFRVIRPPGEGGMGVVYAAYDDALRRAAAVHPGYIH
jgi:hypothetical protein